MFLTGDRNTMDNLLRRAKEYKAIQRIIANMRSERVPENNPQFELAVDRDIKIGQQFLSAARETFVKLYYPFQYQGTDRLVHAEFLMVFNGNNFNGEEQIKKVLSDRQKFTSESPISDAFRNKCLVRLFTLEEMRREDLKSRAAANPAWQWHHPKALDELIDHCLKTGLWHQVGNYILKNPPKEDTSVIVQASWPDKNKSTAILKIIPKFGDVVHYEFNQPATEASDKITDFNSWKTDEMVVYFLCVDSKKEHETGKQLKWVNKITLRYNTYDAGDQKKIRLEASAHDAIIRYSTNGSDPNDSGAIYAGDFIVPKDTRFVQAIADKDGIYSEKIQVSIDWSQPEGMKIEKDKPLLYEKKGMYKTNNNKSTYEELELFRKHNASFGEVFLNFNFKHEDKEYWSSVTFGESLVLPKEKLDSHIEFMRNSMNADGTFEASMQLGRIYFTTGQDFIDWMADKQLQLSDFTSKEITQ